MAKYSRKRKPLIVGSGVGGIFFFISFALSTTGLANHPGIWIARAATLGVLVGVLNYAWTRVRLLERDVLTGLYTRTIFEERLELCALNETDVTIAMMDVNGLKRLNDTLGHDAGDALLCEFSRRLSAHIRLRKNYIAARLSGDEFVVVVTGGKPVDDLSRELEAIIATPYSEDFNEPIASCGLARSENGSREALKCADMAMYIAKEQFHKDGLTYVHIYSGILTTVEDVETDRPLVRLRERIKRERDGR